MTAIMTTTFDKTNYSSYNYTYAPEISRNSGSTVDSVLGTPATQQLFSKTQRKTNIRALSALPDPSSRLHQIREEPISARSYESSFQKPSSTKTSKSIASAPLSFRSKPEPIEYSHGSSSALSSPKRPPTPVKTRPIVSPFDNSTPIPTPSQRLSLGRDAISELPGETAISRLRRLEHTYRITSGSEPIDVGSKLEFSFNETNRKVPLPIDYNSKANIETSPSSTSFALTRSGDLEKKNTPSKPKGLVGLRNLGNTCFMNSCLQCLMHCESLAMYFNQDKHSNEINKKNKMKGQLAKAFGKLVVALSSEDQAISPSEFKNMIEKYESRFSGYNQHDSQEFLRCLLDGLHEDLNRVVEKVPYKEEIFGDDEPEEQKAEKAWQYHLGFHNSFIFDIFCGQLRSAVICETCNHKSSCFDPFLDLSVPIPKSKSDDFGISKKTKGYSLEECLQAFTEEEILSGKEKAYCLKCKTHRTSRKKLTIHKPPPILVIHLKRFYYRYSFREKISSHVSFPLWGLDIGKYCSEETNLQTPPIYDLFATSNHIGTLGAGHYIANCKASDGNWYNFDDSYVSPIDGDQIESSSAYILFYQRRAQK